MPKFSYLSPLDLPEDITLGESIIEINGMKFQSRSDCNYQTDYPHYLGLVDEAKGRSKEWHKQHLGYSEIEMLRQLLQEDLWAFVYFGIKNPLANHPFVVNACKEIQEDAGDSLELWARDHLKSTIITVGRTCQRILNDPELRISIFSATRPLAVSFLKQIRDIFETPFLKWLFPDILYQDPYKESPKWSEGVDGGLVVKRKGLLKEPTVTAYGLSDGLPIGIHVDDLIYDDIVTQDTLSPDMIQKVKDNFDISVFLGNRSSRYTIIGTTYRQDDPLSYIRNKVDPVTGIPMFKVRVKPGTVDGTMKGLSVFLPEKRMSFLRSNDLHKFKCQQLLDPSPKGTERLNPEHLQTVTRAELPPRLYKFMLIEPSGSEGKRQDNRSVDPWAMGVIGVEPYRDDLGLSKIYILDLVIEVMDLIQAQKTAVDMYLRNGRIIKLGVEKVGQSTTEIHIQNALRAKKKFISIENKNLVILRPSGGETHGMGKEFRIESKLAWPLANSKIHILDTVGYSSAEHLRVEMQRFPHWHDDGLEMVSYVYDMIKEYRFPKFTEEEAKKDRWDDMRSKWKSGNVDGWMGH